MEDMTNSDNLEAENSDKKSEEEENTSEAISSGSNLLNFSDLDTNTACKLRGDAIGNTLYSESFVAKTLLRLANVEWNEELENDLCFIWDMTVEKDVCDYLMKLSFPSLVCDVILKYDENRLIEIIIGILANVFCSGCTKTISETEVHTVLQVLNHSDALVLIQVVRFVKAFSYHDKELRFVTGDVLNRLYFILANSLNVQLLTNALDALSAITEQDKLNPELVKSEMPISSLIAYRGIRKTIATAESDEDFTGLSSAVETAFTHLLKVITNYCTCLDLLEDTSQHFNELMDFEQLFLEEVNFVFGFYKHIENLLPVNKSFTFYVESLGYCFPILCVQYDNKLFISLITILNILLTNDALQVSMFPDLLCYIMSRGTIKQIITILNHFPEENICDILHKFKYYFDRYPNANCEQVATIYLQNRNKH